MVSHDSSTRIRRLEGVVSGTISIGGPAVTLTISNAGDTGELTFTGTTGQRIFAQFTNNTINPNCCNEARAYIRQPGGGTLDLGTQIDASPWGGVYFANNNVIDTVTLPTDGEYALVLVPTATETGSVTTTLYDVPADATASVTPASGAGSAVALTTTTPGQNLSVTFTGTAGQRIFAQFTNNTINPDCCNRARAYILRPGGTTTLDLGTQIDASAWGGVYFANNNVIDAVTLPESGMYTLVADPERTQTGGTTFTLYDVPPDPSVPIVIGGPPQTVTTTTPGQNLRLTFTGAINQPVSAQFTNNTINPNCCNQARAYILKPGGTTTLDLGTQSNASAYGGVYFNNGSGIDPVTLPESGTYTLVADPHHAQTGQATFTLTQGGAYQSVTQTYGVCGSSGVNALVGSVCTADPVNSLTGAFTTSETDLSLAATGVSFAFTRSYTSADPTSGRLGTGWTDNYAVSLAIDPTSGNATLHGDEGQQVSYTKQPDGSFVGAPGALSTLTTIGGGYKLVRHEQVTYTFNTSGALQSELDRNGQGLTFGYDGSGRLATVTDASGRTITFGYSGSNTLLSSAGSTSQNTVAYDYTNGQLTSVTLPDPDGVGPLGRPVTRYTYNAGRLETMVDANNKTQVTNLYDSTSGRVTEQTDANNKTTHFAWDNATQTATATDANQHVWKDIYQNNVLIKRISGSGETTLFEHDTDLDVSAVTSPDGSSKTTMVYDNAGNLLTATAPASLSSAQKIFTYDAQNNVKTVTDARSKQTVYGYDTAGNLNSVTLDGQPVASANYNAQGQMLESFDGNGKKTTYSNYDPSGNPKTVTAPDPDGAGPIPAAVTKYTYDAMGNVLTRIDPLGNCIGCNATNYTTTYTYDAEGHLLTETDPLGNVTKHTYDLAGNETSVEDANHHITSYDYDNANHLTKITRPAVNGGQPITTFTYDDVGNRTSEVNPRGNVGPPVDPATFKTIYGYDANNRLASVTTPKGEKTTYSYDASSRCNSVVEPRGNAQGANANDYKTSYCYDAAGRLLTTTDPLLHVTTNHYDAVGNLDWTKDANTHQTNYTYDAAGRILTVTAPDAGLTTYTYDGNGNLKTRKDDNQQTTTYTYDEASQLTQITGQDPDGGGAGTAPVTTYTYDFNGNRLTMIDPNGNATQTAGDGKTTYTYDRDNRLKTIAYSDTTPGVTFNYNAVGNRSSMVDGSGTLTYGYDALDRLTSATRGTNTFSYTYDPAGNVLTRTYPDTTQITYTYDEDNRLASVASGGNTTGYGYDDASNLTRTTLPSGNGYVETRSYDRAGRLTEVKNATNTTTLSDYVSTLDSAGNPTSIQDGTSFTTYTYDSNDRVTGVCFQNSTCPNTSDPFIRWTYDKVGNRKTETRPNGVSTSYTYNALDQLTSAGSTTYTYDQNGNEKSAGTRTFTYDLANRLKTTTSGSTTTTYTYDGNDSRLQASTGNQASKKTNYLWDANRDLPQLALERDGNNALLRRYVYGTRRISMRSGTSDYYYHYDTLGSVRNVTSSTGVTQWTDTYEPFGAIRTETKNVTSAPDNPIKFTGESLDTTGLYHLRARQYDPVTGRFLSRDSVVTPQRLPWISVYAYAANRPTTLVDPSGKSFTPCDVGTRAATTATTRSLQSTGPTPYKVQSCANRNYDRGTGGYVQWKMSRRGNVYWTAHMYSIILDFGFWEVAQFIDAAEIAIYVGFNAPVNRKILAESASPGSYIVLSGYHEDIEGVIHPVHSGCRVP
jgi:RHS repeat-associated protein